MPEEITLVETELTLERPCKHSVLFKTKDPNAVIENIYVSKANMPEIKNAKKVAVTVRIME